MMHLTTLANGLRIASRPMQSVETIAVYIGMLGMPFRVTEPPELVEAVTTLGTRYASAVV